MFKKMILKREPSFPGSIFPQGIDRKIMQKLGALQIGYSVYRHFDKCEF